MIEEIFKTFVETKCKQCTKDRECSIHVAIDKNGRKGGKCEEQEHFGGGNDGK